MVAAVVVIIVVIVVLVVNKINHLLVRRMKGCSLFFAFEFVIYFFFRLEHQKERLEKCALDMKKNKLKNIENSKNYRRGLPWREKSI